MSRRERFALVLLLLLGLVGHGIRLAGIQSDRAPGGITLLSAGSTDLLANQRARSLRLARPLAAGERIDLNQADAEEIARLPRIGRSLAKRIVETREALGGFAELADVDRVAGVGPGLLVSLDTVITLGDTSRVRRRRGLASPPTARAQAGSDRPPPGGPTIWARDLPTVVKPAPSQRRSGSLTRSTPVNLNSASEADLLTLPGIGPARARAILAYRQSHGPFASVSELEKVPGLGARLVRQLVPQVTVR